MDKLEKLYKNANYTAVFVDYNNIVNAEDIKFKSDTELERESTREEVKEILALIYTPELHNTPAAKEFLPSYYGAPAGDKSIVNMYRFMESVNLLQIHKDKRVKPNVMEGDPAWMRGHNNRIHMLNLINECCVELGYPEYYLQGLPYYSESNYARSYDFLKPVTNKGLKQFKEEMLVRESYIITIASFLIPIFGQLWLLLFINQWLMLGEKDTKSRNTLR